MKANNILYTFTNNKNYASPLAVDYLIAPKKPSCDKIIIIGLSFDEESVVIPETIDGLKVIAIDEGAFTGYDKLSRIFVPPTVERIAPDAFSDDIIIVYNNAELSVQNFFVQFKKKQKELIRCQLQGLIAATGNMQNLHKIINIIKKSKDKSTAQENLMQKFRLTAYQADAILDIGLADIAAINSMDLKEKLDGCE